MSDPASPNDSVHLDDSVHPNDSVPPGAPLPLADLGEAFRQRGLGASSGFGVRPAVIVVDFSLGFTDPASPLGAPADAPYDDALRATRTLLDALRVRELPVAFTTVSYPDGPHEAAHFLAKVPSLALLRDGSRWAQLDPRLGARPAEPVWIKRFASAFFGPPLHDWLRAQRADTLIVCGATTSGCVRATVVDGLQHGYRVIVPRSCVADRAESPHQASLFDMNAKYADVLSLEDVLAQLPSPDPAAAPPTSPTPLETP